MEGADRRVRRTKRRLRQALAQLLLEKDLSSITVRELTELADVNRGTFYTHYKDLYDMLEQMENEMFQELEDMLDSYAPDILRQDFSPILREVFTFVGKNQNLCRVFLARQAVDRFSQRLNSLIYRKCLAEWGAFYQRYQELNGITGQPAAGNYALEFVVAGAVGLIRAWLEQGAKESPEEMAQAMLAASPRTFDYTVQPGDTMESVMALFSMSEERFRALNPELTLTTEVTLPSSPLDEYPEETVPAEEAESTENAQASSEDEPPQNAQAAEPATIDLADLLGDQVRTPLEEGTTITIEQNCPLLLVSTVEEATVTRDVAPAVETQEDPTMFLGQQRVVQEGQAGQANILSRVVKRCGLPVASNDISSVVLSEPTALIVGTGTKEMPELPDGCLFLWPVQGTITSEFGYRYIFGETNFHRGLDIAAPGGTAINAAADGTVTFAGERGTYGNLVVITHEMRVIQQVCTRVAVLDGGLVQEEGSVADIFAHPASRAAKRLLLVEDEEEESYAG